MKNSENIRSLEELTERGIDIFDLFYELMKCYKDIFNKDMYKNNKAFIIIIILITLKLFLNIYILLYI